MRFTRYTFCEVHGVTNCPNCGFAASSQQPRKRQISSARNAAQRPRSSAQTMPDIAALIDAIGPAAVARLCGVHRTTVRRWQSGQVTPPASAVALMVAEQSSHRPGPQWSQWRLYGGHLYTPAGVAYTPADIEGIFWQRQIVRALEQENAALRAQVERLRVQLASPGPMAANDAA